MRLPCAWFFVAIVACRGGHVTEVGETARDLARYESAAVRATPAGDVAVKPEETSELEGELITRLEEAKVFAHVARGDAPAQLAVNVTIVKLEDTTNPLDIDQRAHAEARATVQLVDIAANRIVGELVVEGTDQDKKPVIVREKGSARAIALRNVARAIARKLRRLAEKTS